MTPNWEWQQRTGINSVLIVRGDLDVVVGADFVGAVEEVLSGDASTAEVLIDLGEVDFIDSSRLARCCSYGRTTESGSRSARSPLPFSACSS